MCNGVLIPESLVTQPPDEVTTVALVERAYRAGLEELARLDSVEGLQDLRAGAMAVEQHLVRFIRDRDAYFRCQQMMAELRLRTERRIGTWLDGNVSHHGGGDRRSRSPDATPLRDLPEGISKSQSSRFQQVASLPDVVFERYLVVARDARKEITTADLLRLARTFRRGRQPDPVEAPAGGGRTVEDLTALVRRGQRFGTVYADPPWPYQNTATRGAANNHYPTMTVEAIGALPVGQLALESSHCHLWTTNAFLAEALAVLAAWGFDYKGMFVWVKPKIGLGNYWRVAHELLILGTRSNCPFRDKGQSSWRCIEPVRHSAKPEEVRGIVEKVSPGPYLELFGRRLVEGWTVWGNEVAATHLDATHSGASTAESEGSLT